MQEGIIAEDLPCPVAVKRHCHKRQDEGQAPFLDHAPEGTAEDVQAVVIPEKIQQHFHRVRHPFPFHIEGSAQIDRIMLPGPKQRNQDYRHRDDKHIRQHQPDPAFDDERLEVQLPPVQIGPRQHETADDVEDQYRFIAAPDHFHWCLRRHPPKGIGKNFVFVGTVAINCPDRHVENHDNEGGQSPHAVKDFNPLALAGFMHKHSLPLFRNYRNIPYYGSSNVTKFQIVYFFEHYDYLFRSRDVILYLHAVSEAKPASNIQ